MNITIKHIEERESNDQGSEKRLSESQHLNSDSSTFLENCHSVGVLNLINRSNYRWR
ncbi:MAG: hypothetical protein K6T90_09400 [Leptolyngbyaceae cyanobacterium HOT.MB2.61]|nr:hypothetical protein [Leptolyngbyaceae cyanobacterium HOT.MB2.61]